MSTYGRHLDLLGYEWLFADQLSRLVYHKLVAGLESMPTRYLVVEVEQTGTHWTEMGLEVHKVLRSDYIHPLEPAHYMEA